MAKPALFVELPGVLLPADSTAVPLALLPGAGAALARLHARGVAVVAVTDAPALVALFPAFAERLRALVEAAAGALAGSFAEVAGSPASWRKPRPGMLLAAARQLDLDLAASWMIGTRADDAVAAAQAGCAGAVLLGGAALPADDLGIVVAAARDLADAPRVMIPRGGGCWHQA